MMIIFLYWFPFSLETVSTRPNCNHTHLEATPQQLVAQGHPEAQRQSFFLKIIPYSLVKTHSQEREKNACYMLLGPIHCVLKICESDFSTSVHCRFCTWVGSGIVLVLVVLVNIWSVEIVFQLLDILIGICLQLTYTPHIYYTDS